MGTGREIVRGLGLYFTDPHDESSKCVISRGMTGRRQQWWQIHVMDSGSRNKS